MSDVRVKRDYRLDLTKSLINRWASVGLISAAQADQISAYEEQAMQTQSVSGAAGQARRSLVPVIVEALAYVGGIFTIVGLILLVSRFWSDMTIGGRLGLVAVVAAVLVTGGAVVKPGAVAPLQRLQAFLWLASAVAVAFFAVLAALEVAGPAAGMTAFAAASAAVAIENGVLWWWRKLLVQQGLFLVGVLLFSGAMVGVALEGPGQEPNFGLIGLTFSLVGIGIFSLGLARATQRPWLTQSVGAVGTVVGSAMAAGQWQGPGLIYAVAVAVALVSIGVFPGLAKTTDAQLVAGIAGGIGLLEAVPATVGYYGEQAGLATGLSVCAAGGLLIVLGYRQLVRLPVLAEIGGGIGVLAGAAITATQFPGFATIFGLAVSICLILIGMGRGKVLMSAFGSLGLLIYVPWLIGWYFPGEGRAPLILLVSGLLLLGVAMLMLHERGRFRHELGSERHGIPGDNRSAGRAERSLFARMLRLGSRTFECGSTGRPLQMMSNQRR
ncbi:MAG: DUF2157 domain-containing protein [Candidatus Nanopelagicales bacterium]